LVGQFRSVGPVRSGPVVEVGWLIWLVGSGSGSGSAVAPENILNSKIRGPRNSPGIREPGFGRISMAEPLGVHGIWYSIFHTCNKIICIYPLLPEFSRVPASFS
jgi:hypothetical protein